MSNTNKPVDDQRMFYISHLKETILPFWLKNSIDQEYGGFFTCFDNSGEQLVSTDKYIWSQGRMTWIMAKLASMDIFNHDDRVHFLSLSGRCADFIIENCLLEDGTCTFMTDREGNPKEPWPGSGYHISFYVDCFAACGIARYATVSGNRKYLDYAVKLIESVRERFIKGSLLTEPYPAPKGFRHLGVPMMIIMAADEIADSVAEFGLKESSDKWRQYSDECCLDVLDNFIDRDGILREFVTADNRHSNDILLGRYINPGHSIENVWFIIHHALITGNKMMVSRACSAAEKAFDHGWDVEYQGLLLFADKDGGKPAGSVAGMEEEKMIKKILTDWDSKLWWVHSEALYTTLLCDKLGYEGFAERYKMVFNYTFDTFPNINREVGEWIHIRDRQGIPVNKVVALPVKDPFHIIRNLVLIIDCLSNKVTQLDHMSN